MSRMSKKTMKRLGLLKEPEEPKEPELDNYNIVDQPPEKPSCNKTSFGQSDPALAQYCIEREKEKEAESKVARSLRWKLNLWLFWSIVIVAIMVLVCFTSLEVLVCGHDFSFGKKAEAKVVDAGLGVERPELLPLTDSEIKKAEEKEKAADYIKAVKVKADLEAEKKKFRKKHNGNDVHTRIICDNHRHQHTKCEHCGIRMKNDIEYASYYEGPKLERHFARNGKSWDLRKKR